MNYENIKLEKGMYNNPFKSFSETLEELDPSENYDINSSEGQLDAFQRQLKRFNIRVNGPNCDFISKFYENSNSSVLFPEYIARCVEKGIMQNQILKQIVATTSKIDNLNYRSLIINSEDELNNQPKPVTEGEAIPETQLKISENNIKLQKLGRILTASYEAIEFQKINTFARAIERIGVNFANSMIVNAIDVLTNGDSKKNPATSVATKESDKISYDDLIEVWTKFENYEMNTIIAHPVLIAKIAKIEELKNPISKLNFPTHGTLATPLGAQILRSNVAPKQSVIFLDNNYALNQIVAKGITVESDKLIDKQISRTSISIIHGFSIICNDARIIMNINSSK